MKYKIRVYIYCEEIGLIVNEAIDCGLFVISQSFDGKNGILAIYDGEVSKEGLALLIMFGIRYLPLNNYGDFNITCPNCGRRIEDEWILKTYDDNVLSGYNICHDTCGAQMADVEFI